MPEFVALHEWLAPHEPALTIESETEVAIDDEPQEPRAEVACLREIRLFQAAMREAIDRRASDAAREIAIHVLARELRLAPCDLEKIVAQACERYRSRNPLAIRVHPDDVESVRTFECVIGDATLRRGDAIVELADGSIDARLGVRLERVLSEIQ